MEIKLFRNHSSAKGTFEFSFHLFGYVLQLEAEVSEHFRTNLEHDSERREDQNIGCF